MPARRHSLAGGHRQGGQAWVAPITATVRAALDRILRERPSIGPAYLFPSAKSPGEPITEDLAREWLLEAERLAELPKLEGGAWHPYRRKWATARKHLPLKDVAAAGGWKCTETLLRCYQQPDEDTTLSVVLAAPSGGERKHEARGRGLGPAYWLTPSKREGLELVQ